MQIEPTWWISVVEAPVVAALFWMIHGLRQDLQNRIERSDLRETEAVSRARDDLAEFKLEVARTYVPLSLIRDVDRRLSQQLAQALSAWFHCLNSCASEKRIEHRSCTRH